MEIKVGKRYLIKPRLNPEYACSGCGEPSGRSIIAKGELVVTVMRSLAGVVVENHCHQLVPAKDGIYEVHSVFGRAAAPYTWLEPLSDEVYE